MLNRKLRLPYAALFPVSIHHLLNSHLEILETHLQRVGPTMHQT